MSIKETIEKLELSMIEGDFYDELNELIGKDNTSFAQEIMDVLALRKKTISKIKRKKSQTWQAYYEAEITRIAIGHIKYIRSRAHCLNCQSCIEDILRKNGIEWSDYE